MESLIDSLLSSVTDLLFYPVVLALLGMLAWIVFCTGELLREAWQRTQGQRVWCDQYLQKLTDKLKSAPDGYVDIELEKVIQSAEKAGAR